MMKTHHPVLFLLISLILLITKTLSQPVKFNHLTMENGLSNNVVYAMLQDQYGFMWFGTNDGLNRYDGYNIRVFRNDPNDSNTVSNNGIWALAEDRKGNIWIGTKNGWVDKFDPVTTKFTHWKLKSILTGEISVKSICEDKRGKIWIGTFKNGLYQLNPENNNLEHWKANQENSLSLNSNYNLSVIEDNFGKIIVGTYNGLNVYDPEKPDEGFKKFYHIPNDPKSLSNNIIWSLTKSKSDKSIIWVGTANNLTKFNSTSLTFEQIEISNPNNFQYGTSSANVIEEEKDNENLLWINSYAGLVMINLSNNRTHRFLHNEDESQSLINNQINQILVDGMGVIWLATENGISYSTKKSSSFNSNFINYPQDIASILKRKNITALSKNSEEEIWIGTMEGLFLLEDLNLNPKLKMIIEFDDYYIWSLTASSNNSIWVGTYGKGLWNYNHSNRKIRNWDIVKNRFQTQAPFYNKSLIEDSNNDIWVGYWGNGIAKINTLTGKYDLWVNDPENKKSLSNNDIWSIKEDKFGRIWIGTLGGGLNLFQNINGGIFHRFANNDSTNKIILSNDIYEICEEKNDTINHNSILWLGTSGGLVKFEIFNKDRNDPFQIDLKIKSYTTNDGLPNNSINSIIEDNDKILWIGTSSGISSFNIRTEEIANFTKSDGLNGLSMNHRSNLKLENETIIIGGSEGLNIFDPSKIHRSKAKPNLVFTDFLIFNKSVKVEHTSVLKNSIFSTNQVDLSYWQDVISIEFAALDYNSSQSIKYAYKMEGFDTEWIENNDRRFVSYTNLSSGDYKFNVKSTNADGIWNDIPKSLSISINPPFWQTWWAYVTYLLLIGFGYYSLRKYEENKRAKKEEERLRKAEELAKLEKSELRAEAAEYKAQILETAKEIEKQQIRHRISTDLHDEIGSNLSSIILLSSLAERKDNYDIEMKKYIKGIHNAGKKSAEAIRDIIWLINPASDQIGKLATRMVDTANIMLGNIKCEIKTSNFNINEKLRPDVKRNIFLIYKEILTNIIKHSQTEFVKIEIIEKDNKFRLLVIDNGIGFDINNKGNGNGLKNLKYRTNQIDGHLKIESEIGKGTTISLHCIMA